ncbi:acyltransferase domain-containing protein [Streptomyces sp. L7]
MSDFMESFDPDSVTVPGLAFGAIGAPAERVLSALAAEWPDSGIVLSHDNAPGQSMVCGPEQAVDAFVRSFRTQGVLSQVLPFQSGFHTPMLRPYLAPIEEATNRFRLHPPTVPLWSGTTASPFPTDETAVRELFIRHLLEPVRFRQLVEAMYDAGHRAFVQVGLGQLGSLVDATLSGRDHLVIAANSPHRSGLAQLRRVAVALWAAGATVDPLALAPQKPARRQERPPVRLDLDGALVSLDAPSLVKLRAELRTPLPASSVGSPLDALTDRFPAAAELHALMRETADTAAQLLGAGSRRAVATIPAPPRQQPPAPPPGMADHGPCLPRVHALPSWTTVSSRSAPTGRMWRTVGRWSRPPRSCSTSSRRPSGPRPACERSPCTTRGSTAG